MGWLFSWDRSVDRKALIAEKVADYKREGMYLDHSAVGNTLYIAAQMKTEILIVVYLLQGGGQEHGWGYKDLDESMGPMVNDCPEKILKLSTCQHPGAVAWRERCRAVRKAKREATKYLRGLEAGTMVDYGGSPVEFRFVHSPTFFVGKDKAGNLYRYRTRYIEVPENAKAASASQQ